LTNCRLCTNGKRCNQCADPYLLKFNPETDQDSCVSSCGLKYYEVNKVCIPCDFRCQTCSGPSNTECPDCDIQKDGVYKSGLNTCACMDGYGTSLELQKCFRIF